MSKLVWCSKTLLRSPWPSRRSPASRRQRRRLREAGNLRLEGLENRLALSVSTGFEPGDILANDARAEVTLIVNNAAIPVPEDPAAVPTPFIATTGVWEASDETPELITLTITEKDLRTGQEWTTVQYVAGTSHELKQLTEMAELVSGRSPGAMPEHRDSFGVTPGNPDGLSIEPQLIFGPDGRQRVGDTRNFPYSAVVQLAAFDSVTGIGSVSSGALISEFHVLTAAHCIRSASNEGNRFASTVRVAPGNSGDHWGGSSFNNYLQSTSRWFGEVEAVLLRAYEWSATNWNYDFALVTLDRSVGSPAFGTGYFGFGFDENNGFFSNRSFNSAGYPGDLNKTFFPGWNHDQYWAFDPITSVTTHILRSNQLDIFSGNSGGPLWQFTSTGERYIFGVCSHSATSSSGAQLYNAWTRITSDKFNFLVNSMNSDKASRRPVERADLVDWDGWFNTSFAGTSTSVVSPGLPFEVQSFPRNNGTAATGGFTVRYRLSTDPWYDATDTLLGDVRISNLSPFRFAEAKFATNSFPAVPAGSYYVVWQIDVFNEVTEFKYGNNSGFLTTPITVMPAANPGIDIRGNGFSIAPGDTSPSLTDHTEFGSTNVSSGTITRTFTVANTGGGTLTLTGSPTVQVTGSHAADFTVGLYPWPSVGTGLSTTFQVTFNPSAAGSRSALITIPNNVPGKNPYTFAIRGDGLAVAPGAPTGVMGAAGNGQVSLTWSAPFSTGGAAITNYVVQYSSNGGGSWTTFNRSASSATSATVTGLTNGTAYVFRVAAVNSAGMGGYSTPSAPVTPVSVVTVPGAPFGVVGAAGNAQVSLTWVPPSSTGGAAITDYVVQYSSNGGGSWTTFNRPASSATSATVTGLTNGTAYVFRVAAVNSAGMGAFSSASAPITPMGVVTVPGPPIMLVGSAGNRQVSLTWVAPSSTGGAAITDYVVQYSSNGGGSWTTFNRPASSATAATVTGLDNGTTYTFRVAAVNSAGMGDYSAMFTITLTGPTDRPLAVESVTVVPGAYGAGSQVPFTVVFSDIVVVRGRPQIQVMVGGRMRSAIYDSGSGTAVLTFRLTVDRRMNSDVVAVGNRFVFPRRSAITAAGGRSLGRELGSFAGMAIPGVRLDGVPPRVVGRVTAPAAGTYIVGQSLDFIVRFSEAVFVNGTPQIALTGLNAARQAIYVSGSGTAELTFRYIVQANDARRPRARLGLGRTIAVSGGGFIADTAGNGPRLRIQAPTLRGIVIDGSRFASLSSAADHSLPPLAPARAAAFAGLAG